MILTIKVHVKFRAFFITFGQVDKTFAFPVPPVAELFAGAIQNGLKINERGVSITATLGPPDV